MTTGWPWPSGYTCWLDLASCVLETSIQGCYSADLPCTGTSMQAFVRGFPPTEYNYKVYPKKTWPNKLSFFFQSKNLFYHMQYLFVFKILKHCYYLLLKLCILCISPSNIYMYIALIYVKSYHLHVFVQLPCIFVLIVLSDRILLGSSPHFCVLFFC